MTHTVAYDIDPERLPNRCLVDTGVLLRALGHFEDEHSPPSIVFFEAMLQSHDKRILLAAPVLTELLRGGEEREIPRTPHLEPVAFGMRAATICGKEMPIKVLRKDRDDGMPLTYLKYDAMIIACAKSRAAECIVAIDPDHHKLARHVRLPVYHPNHFQRTQLRLVVPPRSEPVT